MDLGEYRVAVIEGFKSILGAAAQWRENPMVEQVNRRLWGRWWWASLTLLVLGAVVVKYLQPFALLVGLVPPLVYLGHVPGVVRDLFLSAPALFAFVVVWRVRCLRSTERGSWPSLTRTPDFAGSFFDAGALPVAVATVVLAIGGYAVALVKGISSGVEVSGVSVLARTLLTVALVAGTLSIHRTIGAGLGKLLSTGFVVWGMHLAIGYSVPWMTAWWAYLPFVGRYAPQRSGEWVTFLFDVAVACAAWIAAREKCCATPLWSDAPPPPPPPPPPPESVPRS